MKRIISLILVLLILLSAVGCGEVEHVHNFEVSEADSTAATCLEGGLEVRVCSCGEKLESDLEALGHDMTVAMEVKPKCTSTGSVDYRCSRCGKLEFTNVEALGHAYEESPSEPSRVIRCTNEGCTSCLWGESSGKNAEALTFNFTKEDEAAIDAKYDEVLAMVSSAPRYDSTLHAYAEEGELAEEYEIVDAAQMELYDMIMNVISQETLAMVAYYCELDNEELEANYTYMQEYQTAVVAKFYTLSRPFYDSCYRDFYYYGMTEEEINAYLFDSDAVSNPEYTALKDRNSAIEVEALEAEGDELSKLYEEFVENNNKMARLMGYDNYLEYAYENVYGRDYTYEEAIQFSDYVKLHISPVFNKLYNKFNTLTGYTQEDLDQYNAQTTHSFFRNLAGNTAVNDYIDLFAFTSNPDKNITFSDEFNKLMGDGNVFRGDYDGAFVTSIHSARLPIAYFGHGTDSGFTVVHEFGHYMNEVYTSDIAYDVENEFTQSYDLLEMHSQGNELLYLCYLRDNVELSEMAHNLVETYSLVNMFYAIMAGMTIDSFEQAIYLNEYDGTNADVIMADGKITYDEYDLLYEGVCADYGVEDALDGYWRHGMTIQSPCYYVSYSVSAISVLQLYEMANTEGFDVAKEAYLKLFTYIDENPEMTMEEVLEYAGLLSFVDEELYISLNEYMMK